MTSNNDNNGSKKQVPVIVQYLQTYKDQIAAALPRHLSADRMARIALTEIRKTPKLLQCSPASVFGAIIQASQLGLEPGSGLGHAYLVPFKQECQLIIGYRGMLDLAYRTDRVTFVEATPVFAGDDFKYSKGLNEYLELNRQQPEDWSPEKLTHVFVIARMRGDTQPAWNVYSREFIEARRKRSKAANDGPWVTDYVEMACKTGVRHFFKYLPVSIELQRAVNLDEAASIDMAQNNAAVIEGTFERFVEGAVDLSPEADDSSEVPEGSSTADKVKQKLGKKRGKKVTGKDGGEGATSSGAEPVTDDAQGSGGSGGSKPSAQEVLQLVETAESMDDVNYCASLADAIPQSMLAEFKDKLKAARARCAA